MDNNNDMSIGRFLAIVGILFLCMALVVIIGVAL
jgi:hypothetical protein